MSDQSQVLASVEQIPQACQDAWNQVKKITLPKTYQEIDSIVCCGMGGSSLAAHLTKSLYFDTMNRPFEIVKNYSPPSFINEKTLVVLLNYSGETEETFNCAQIAHSKNSLLFGITTGRKMGQFLKENNLPRYLINPEYNPSGQSRLGLHYLFFGLLGLLKKINLIDLTDQEVQKAISSLKASSSSTKMKAEETAQKLTSKIPLLISAGHLEGNAHVASNQINETSKHFSTFFLLPELNHHLLEGMVKPETNPETLAFLFLNSDLYSPKIKKRVRLTQEVIKKNNISVFQYQTQTKTKLAQILESLQFSGHLSRHLAQLNQVNPAKTPWVKYFKNQMKKEV